MNVWVLDYETHPERHKNVQDLGMCAPLLVGGIKLAISTNLFLSFFVFIWIWESC